MITVKLINHIDDKGVSNSKGNPEVLVVPKETHLLGFDVNINEKDEITYYKKRFDSKSEVETFMSDDSINGFEGRTTTFIGSTPSEYYPSEAVIIKSATRVYVGFVSDMFVMNSEGKTIDHLVMDNGK